MCEPWTLFTYRWATNTAAIRVEVYDHRGACVFATVTLGWHAAIMDAHKAAGDHPLTTHVGSRHQFNARHDRMTRSFVMQAAKRHGFTARWSTEWSEWRITPRHLIVGETREGATYHTTDNQDAYDTIKAMSRARREARLVVRDARHRERDEIRNLVYGACGGTPAQLDAIVDRIDALQYQGRYLGHGVNIWHEASAVYGTADRCPCFPCTKQRDARVAAGGTPRGWGPPLSMDQLGEARDAYMREQDQEEALFFRTHDDDPRGDSSL